MTDFDVAATVKAEGPDRWSAEIPPDWTQGRTTFGGLVAALAVQVTGEVLPDRPIRSLDLAFVAALPPGPVQIAVQVLAAGRAISHLGLEFRSAEGVLAAHVRVVAGTARSSPVVVTAAGPQAPEAGGVPDESGIEFPYIEGVTPVFIQNVALRWCGSAFPFTGAGPEGGVIRAWVRHRTPATGLPAVVALADATPPTVLPMLTGPAPASTVRWAIQFTDEVPDEAGSRWFWSEAETVHASDGYAIEQGRLYLDGRLIASSEQLVAVYNPRQPPPAG